MNADVPTAAGGQPSMLQRWWDRDALRRSSRGRPPHWWAPPHDGASGLMLQISMGLEGW